MAHKLRFMVVDDELIVRESLAAWLEKEGATVDKAESGEQALGLMELHFYDILFVDIKMPGTGGFGLLESVRKLFPTMLVVIITAYGTVDHAIQAMRLGANDFLVKPFDPEGLGQSGERIHLKGVATAFRVDVSRFNTIQYQHLWRNTNALSKRRTSPESGRHLACRLCPCRGHPPKPHGFFCRAVLGPRFLQATEEDSHARGDGLQAALKRKGHLVVS